MNLLENFKSKKYLIAGAGVLAIAVLAVILFTSSKAYAVEEFWKLKVGTKTVSVLSTESQANKVIEKIKAQYIKEGAEVESVSVDPEMTVEKEAYHVDDKPEISSVNETVNYLLTGTKVSVPYTIKKGDSLWSISEKFGLTVDELKDINEDVDLSEIFPGDEVKVEKLKPFVTVTTKQTVTSEKKIKYKTIYKESSKLAMNTTKVSQKGKNGKKSVTEYLVMENGKVVNRVVKSSKVLRKAVTRVVLKGTGAPNLTEGGTYSGSGQAVANYALNFVGNPYVYGGSSLTGGADCSGFVMAVYQKFGISLPHNAGTMASYGRSVSLAQAQPGDLICYGWHVSIYLGGGREVHAVNERMGIATTAVGYVGPVVAVRRIIE
ncbi:cell wall-associated NlpC family hydrolase [Clostridiales Family XIII bacterium PM5-7]